MKFDVKYREKSNIIMYCGILAFQLRYQDRIPIVLLRLVTTVFYLKRAHVLTITTNL